MSDGGPRATQPKHPTGGCGRFPQRYCDHETAAVNLPSSRLFRACPMCNGRGVGPLRELRQWWPLADELIADEWVPLPCVPCSGRGWVRA